MFLNIIYIYICINIQKLLKNPNNKGIHKENLKNELKKGIIYIVSNI